MRQTPLLRTAVLAVLVVSVFAASGCRWFRKNSPYAQSAEARPLEVPPDLDHPNTEAALGGAAATTSVTRSSMAPGAAATAQGQAARPAAPGGFTVAGEQAEVFDKVGQALASIQGLTVASKAQLLGTYDVSYEGSNFLVRVSKVDAGVYVSAVDPRGVAAGGEAPAKVLAQLRTALGG